MDALVPDPARVTIRELEPPDGPSRVGCVVRCCSESHPERAFHDAGFWAQGFDAGVVLRF